MIIAVNFPIYAIGKKKPEKNQGFNGIRTRVQALSGSLSGGGRSQGGVILHFLDSTDVQSKRNTLVFQAGGVLTWWEFYQRDYSEFENISNKYTKQPSHYYSCKLSIHGDREGM